MMSETKKSYRLTFSVTDEMKRRIKNAALYVGLEEADFIKEIVQISLDMMDENRGAPIPDPSEDGIKVTRDLMQKSRKTSLSPIVNDIP